MPTVRLAAPATSLGSLLRSLTTLMVKKFYFISSLTLPWCSFVLFFHILPLVPREQRPAPPSVLHLLRRLQRAMRLPLSLLFWRLYNPDVLSPSLLDKSSSPFTSFAAPCIYPCWISCHCWNGNHLSPSISKHCLGCPHGVSAPANKVLHLGRPYWFHSCLLFFWYWCPSAGCRILDVA